MNTSFFSSAHIQVLHRFLDTYVNHPSQKEVTELFAPIRPNIDPSAAQERLTIARNQRRHKDYLIEAWGLFTNSPYNPQFAKILCDAAYRHQHTKQDQIALLFIAKILCTLLPEDQEAQEFLQRISSSSQNRVVPWIFLLLTICFFLFVYQQTSKRIELYTLPEITEDSRKRFLPPTLAKHKEINIVLEDQGSFIKQKEKDVFSYLLIAQFHNQGVSSLVYVRGFVDIYDQADQIICTEPVTILAEHHGPLYPKDDGYISTEVQCTSLEDATPYRVVLRVDQLDTNTAKTPPEDQYVATFPITTIKITKRFSSITAIDEGFWLFNQFVIRNEDNAPKKNIRVRIHYYDSKGDFLAIEERRILKPDTNILPSKKHMLHSIGVRLSEPPTRMDIEVVDCE